MILLHDIVEILDLPDLDRNGAFCVRLVERSFVSAALSIVTVSGLALFRMALSRKRLAAAASRLAVNRKSTASPCLSTALYRYFEMPLTLMYVSSIRQLVPTACLCFPKAFSNPIKSRPSRIEYGFAEITASVIGPMTQSASGSNEIEASASSGIRSA
jgi:hypothetical protein